MADNVQTQHRAISNSFKAKRSIAILLANPPSDMSNRAAFLSWWADVEEAHEIYIHLARQYPDCVVPFEALPEYARYEASRVELEHNTVAESCESNERAARLSTADSKRKYIEPQQSGQSTSTGSRVSSAVSSATLPDSSQALVTANFQAAGLASKPPGVTPTMKNSEMKQELDGHEERLRQFLLAVRGNLSQSGENALTAAMAEPAQASYSGGRNSGPHTPSAESLPKFTTTINHPSDVAPRAAPAAKQPGGFTHVAGQNVSSPRAASVPISFAFSNLQSQPNPFTAPRSSSTTSNHPTPSAPTSSNSSGPSNLFDYARARSNNQAP